MKAEYDSKTAITFLMLGLGIGAFLSLILPARQTSIPDRKSDQPKTPGLGRMSA